MDAGAVTTARNVMRPAHPVQHVTSTSKVRRMRVAQSTRKIGAWSAPRRRRSQCAMERMFGATCKAAPVTRSVDGGAAEAVATSAASPVPR